MSDEELIPYTEITVWEAQVFAEVLLSLAPFDAQLRGFKDEDLNLLAWVEETMLPMQVNSGGDWEYSLTDPENCAQLETVVDYLVVLGHLNTSDSAIDDEIRTIGDHEAFWQMNVYASTKSLNLLKDVSNIDDLKRRFQVANNTGFRKIFIEMVQKGLTEFVKVNQDCLHKFEPIQLDDFDQECVSCRRQVWDPTLYKEIYGK